MITVVEGAVGAGKTYWVVSEVAKHLRAGGIVASNLSLNLVRLRALTGRRLSSAQFLPLDATSSPFDIPRGDFRGSGRRKVMVVLDEALNWFASSKDTNETGKNWQTWLRQSDKLGQNVFFVAQRFDRSAKWLRELAQLVVSVKNFGQLRWLGLPWGKIFGLSRVSAWVRWDLTLQQRVGWGLYVLNSEVWSCYDTSVLYGFPASSNAYDGFSMWPPHPFPKKTFLFLGVWSAWGVLRYLLSSL